MALVERQQLRDLLLAGPVWGAELDITFRVLALTIEPAAELHPDPAADDRRLQVLLHPVSAVAASLLEHADGTTVVRRFDQDQLPDVVAALGGAVPVEDPLLDAPPDLDALSPRLSMRGQATVGDGIRHHVHLRLEADDLTFELWASFDDAEVRTPEQWDPASPR